MDKSRINILIVEDDTTQGKALEEAFNRTGYNVIWKESSVAALTQAQHTEFHAMIVDCMLPKMNGVDLVEEILNLVPYQPKVFLASGIYKDRKFIHEAMEKTKAESFSIKPYDLQVLVSAVEGQLSHLIAPERPPILRLYGAEPISQKELIDLLKEESTQHAFHLIKLYQRIQQAKLTGDLNLTSAIGDSSSVSFYKGQVFAVKTPNKESYFGSLAISKGFVAPEDVLEALSSPSQKMLGQKLIDSMSLSPHAIQIIITEQLALRLSQTVQDDVVSLEWTNKPYPPPTEILPQEQLESLQSDWLNSKVTPDWIHSTLMVWGAFQLDGVYHNEIKGVQRIEKILSNKTFNTASDLGPLFVHLINSTAFIGSRVDEKEDFSFLSSRLDRLSADIKNLNYFQFLGVGEKAHQREVSRAYESLKETFEPSALPSTCPPDLREKAGHVFAHIQHIYSTFSDENLRTQYLNDLQSKRAQEAIESEPIFHAAVLELQEGQYRPAAERLQRLIDRKIEVRDLKAYRLWAGLKCDRHYNAIRLDQIPPEERHSAAYMMAKGVCLRRQRQYKKAFEAYRTAHILEPRLNIAGHELKRLRSDLERSGSNRDLAREVRSFIDGLSGRNRKSA